MRVLHLTGSAVDPLLDDVSRLYARGCLDALAPLDDLEHVVAHVSPGGAWRFPTSLDDASLAAAPPMTFGEAVTHLEALRPDVALPQMFCRPGMTAYRGLLELLDIPYVGNRPEVMAVGADKPRASALVAAAGVSTPERQVARPGDPLLLALPVVVKPADADNSLGVTLVRDAAAYDEAVREACGHGSDGRAVVETYVELGREVRCAVVERGPGDLVALPLEEYAVDPDTKPVRDHDDKLRRDDGGDLGLVAKDAEHAWIVDPADPVTAPVQAAALAAYDALGCRHHGLFDFRVDPDGVPFFLEASLYCSFAPTSVVVVMAAAAGTTLPELFCTSVERACPSRPRCPSRPARGDAMTTTPTLTTEVLDPVGVRVTGLQVADDPTAPVDALRGLLAEHGVAVLPGQVLDDDAFLAFLQGFGDLTFTQGETPLEGHPDLNVISNVGRWDSGTPPKSNFHVDTSYVRRPPAYTALRAVTVPEQGGATQFTNQYRAAETLPDDLRRRVEGRTITHVVTGVELGPDDESSADHPILRPHPVTGRETLFLTSPARCASVSGLSQEESDELVAALLAHSTRPDNTLDHRWAPGDLVIWDNGCVLHRADHAGVVGDRVMHRGMVGSYA
ncbi:TauD/TfdA family dioxygenase [Nocardioides litoris]|uniref:TauD/TfdA family dioxygenase n=1 Tax=Nocardioides litoris TaxID=1926648 RepID=UPI001B87EB24|nr:TauD/TfdA family dioxygenase [Nocardioides litoris]